MNYTYSAITMYNYIQLYTRQNLKKWPDTFNCLRLLKNYASYLGISFKY